jgi:hypothetical protein
MRKKNFMQIGSKEVQLFFPLGLGVGLGCFFWGEGRLMNQ